MTAPAETISNIVSKLRELSDYARIGADELEVRKNIDTSIIDRTINTIELRHALRSAMTRIEPYRKLGEPIDDIYIAVNNFLRETQ